MMQKNFWISTKSIVRNAVKVLELVLMSCVSYLGLWGWGHLCFVRNLNFILVVVSTKNIPQIFEFLCLTHDHTLCRADDITLKYHFSVAIVLFFESIQNVHINFSSFGTWIRHTLRIKGEFQSTPDLVRVVNPTDSSQWLWFTEVSCAINIDCFDAYRSFLRYKILRSQAERVFRGLKRNVPPLSP